MSEHSLARRFEAPVEVSPGGQRLRFFDFPLPFSRLSRRSVQDLKDTQALLAEYQHFVIALRNYVIELEKLHDVDAYVEVDRLAVRVRIAHAVHELLDVGEQAEVTRLERHLQQAKLRRQIAEVETPRSKPDKKPDKVTRLRQMAAAVEEVLQNSGLAVNDPVVVSLRIELAERMIQKLS